MPYSDRRIPFPRPRLTPVPYLWWWTTRLHARSLYGINRPWSSVFNPKDNCNFCTRPWPKFPVYNSRCESLFLHLHGPLLHLPLFLPFFSRGTKVLVQRVLAIRGDRVRLSSGVLALKIHQLERVGLKQWSHHDLDLQLKRELHWDSCAPSCASCTRGWTASSSATPVLPYPNLLAVARRITRSLALMVSNRDTMASSRHH